MTPPMIADAELRQAHAAATAAVLALRRLAGDRYEAAKRAADVDPRSLRMDDERIEAGRIACAVDKIVVPTLAQLGLRVPSRHSDSAVTAEGAL